MVLRTPRFLFAISCLLLVAGNVLHTSSFPKAASAVANSNLPAIFVKAFKALWLADSTTMLALAIIFGWLAVKPFLAPRSLIFLISLIPAGTAAMIYVFMGGFFAGHLMLASAALAFVAGLMIPASVTTSVAGQSA